MDKQSFTAADNNIPIKIMKDQDMIHTIAKYKYIPLRHLQLCPTNKCNLSCKFCSCKDRNKNAQLTLKQVEQILLDAKDLGCRAVTITGGGEPLMHPDINKIILYAHNLGIKIGLVTNGLLLDKLEMGVEWCRISFDSDRELKPLIPKIEAAVSRFPNTDWAFSFVLYKDFRLLTQVMSIADNLDFTHVRVVSDIYDPDNYVMNSAKSLARGVDGKAIYQPRSKPSKGVKKCLVSLLRPTISAEGNIYPCCGAQYAINGSNRDFTKEMCMGKVEDLKSIWKKQKHFNGSICDVCYYGGYNNVLNLLESDVTHKEWV